VGLRDARRRRDEARKLLSDGIDPSAERASKKEAQQRAALSAFEAVARAWLEHRGPAWTAGTLKMIQASLENDVCPALGARPIEAITPADVRSVVQAIDARGAGETAGRVFQRIRAVYRYAVAHDFVKDDPTYPLKPSEILKPRQVRHRAALAETDLPDFLRRLEAYQGEPSTRLALTLLMLTAVRPVELRGALWSEIDVQKALWRVPASRMKMKVEHLVPLSAAALRVIAAMRSLSVSGPLVFPSPFYPGKPLSDGTLNSALARIFHQHITGWIRGVDRSLAG
jgi:integrase